MLACYAIQGRVFRICCSLISQAALYSRIDLVFWCGCPCRPSKVPSRVLKRAAGVVTVFVEQGWIVSQKHLVNGGKTGQDYQTITA